MDSIRKDTLYFALNELADINAVAGTYFYERFMPLGIELGANILPIEGHGLTKIKKAGKCIHAQCACGSLVSGGYAPGSTFNFPLVIDSTL